jgi:G3E family GTPase
MIPVTVLTGFLGSGKTTLLGRLLKSAEFARTAVIINEFGEIGLDHELIETSEESFVELQTGCLCCAVRDDLVLTLKDIVARREQGTVMPFERVVIETSGLADPAPILHALMSDAGLVERLSLAGVVTTIDAVNGAATLQAHFESVKQAAVADRFVLTKGDLTSHLPEDLMARLAAINPGAELAAASFGEVDPGWLVGGAPAEPSAQWRTPETFGLDAPQISAGSADHPHHHRADIACFALLREAPLPAAALMLFLEILAEHCGGDLLRLKGIVNVAESAGQPAVIHGVQHVFHPPAWLERWPSADRRTRMVFITRGIPQAWIEALLAAVEAEVAEVSRNRALTRD